MILCLVRKIDEGVQFIHRGSRINHVLSQVESILQSFCLLSRNQRRRGVQAHDVSFRPLPAPENIPSDNCIVFRLPSYKVLRMGALQAELRWFEKERGNDAGLAF